MRVDRASILVVSGALVAAAAAAPPAALGKRGPCIPGSKAPKCSIARGKVVVVDDGDTINVRFKGARVAARTRIRLTGIQAMELSSYSRKHGRKGDCNAVEATERLEALLRRGRGVRVVAVNEASATGKRQRLRRAVYVKQGKRWVDVGAQLLRAGLALWFPNPAEWAWNRSYSRLAQEAAARGARVWNPQACVAGPSPGSVLKLKVKWDANDNDAQNLNGEWVRITNTDPVNAVPLSNWWFRDSHLRRYTFPPTATVPAGGSIELHVGRGVDDAGTLHWGLDEAVFENATDNAKQIGDGGYLFDPEGDLRAYVQYPCRTNCHEPLDGKVAVHAKYKAPESIRIENVSSETISLDAYEMESKPFFYEFGPDAILAPGQSLTLWVGETPLVDAPVLGRAIPDTPMMKTWGFDRYLLSDKKDVVTLRNPVGAPVACDAWGGERCPTV